MDLRGINPQKLEEISKQLASQMANRNISALTEYIKYMILYENTV